ncbi:MAG: hypothetical protein Q8R82_01610 [Hyphomonadaceae bacterium]|nr:hypothetical protein [Hyphomonadaceae bacterium]
MARRDLTLRELLDEHRRQRDALVLIAEAVEALKAPPEPVQAIALVARKALRG